MLIGLIRLIGLFVLRDLRLFGFVPCGFFPSFTGRLILLRVQVNIAFQKEK